MRNIRDTVHAFQERPHYDASELDTMFERAVTGFLKKKYGVADFPISTDDITTLIEQDVTDLDQYADLTTYGAGVEGMTEFQRGGKKPIVRISETVHRYENRLRTTLTHEYGHVVLHSYLFAMAERQMKLGPNQKPNAIYCYRDNMLPAGKTDWMEWQAGYASGAALMPKSYVTKVVAEIHERFGIFGPVPAESDNGKKLVAATIDAFQVSRDAALVRLKVLNFIGPEQATRSLFG
ncbi:ImmA/IrrE family metallo-endopeptidase [Bradyrhizobium sp. IC3195]|uniref:ImmA/IrrE family metallo-endopeptidase n=1 Tax=Bradyrhizobium sp. IC3195 TaxID=2793804 RepID=UPI001CD4A86A|nr:ImmA/IrrE family metallo-endopeptidase [Bradyrhizobium sp. IC3195]MCA1471159.1 ImmA/IrrE family metallo-endopeptidase [Bradyrhizobium sp. IC3195]